MRYLTHETEDAFWMSHGARPHPLAKAEEEKKAQLKLQQEEQQQLEAKRVAFVEPDQISNVSSTSSRSAESQGVFSEQLTNAGSEPSGASLERNQKSPTDPKSRKDYISMTDDEILKAQKHAERVGYKVTTV
jgi:hypothetical protein